ncbi:MAG: hypothetical protein K2I40_01810, partial [Bifidobacterium castoris]|nr:hypothetical protein [Bifidobacterium castoris]
MRDSELPKATSQCSDAADETAVEVEGVEIIDLDALAATTVGETAADANDEHAAADAAGKTADVTMADAACDDAGADDDDEKIGADAANDDDANDGT